MGNGLVGLQKMWVPSGKNFPALGSKEKKEERQRMQRMKSHLM